MTAAATNVRAVPSRRASRRASRRDALRAGPPRARSVAASVADEPPSDDTTDDWVAWQRTRRARAREVTHALLHPGGPLEHRLIRAPLPDAPVPASLLALATGEPARHLRASLHPRRLRFPDVEDALRASCELTPGDRRLGARRLRCRAANDYLARLFLIAGTARDARSTTWVLVTRVDLFHGHVFAARDVVGVLMHAHEYPAHHPETFPVHLGNCQTNSPYAFDPSVAARRNILWVARPSDREAAFASSPRSTRRGGEALASFLNCWRCRNCSRRTRETSVQSRGTSCIFTVLGIEDPNTRCSRFRGERLGGTVAATRCSKCDVCDEGNAGDYERRHRPSRAWCFFLRARAHSPSCPSGRLRNSKAGFEARCSGGSTAPRSICDTVPEMSSMVK